MDLKDIPYIIYAEETPNPSSVKFVANKLLLVSGASADYLSVADATDAPLVKELFKFPFVKSVFIASNFITITKHDSIEWEEIRDELRVFITNYLNQGKAVIEKLPQKAVAKDSGFKETVTVNTQHSSPTN
ncbi:MAG: NifU N-terminal domain-containing protein, partial [Bacteroidia bacterium]